jgi:hypothetical protein
MRRRSFLKQGMLVMAGARTNTGLTAAEPAAGLVREITKEVVFKGRDRAGTNWFHPRACRLPDGRIFMTLQSIEGSDYFGPVHFTLSKDEGRNWSPPLPAPPLGRVPAADGFEEGVCDVVPEWHDPTGTVLALGHNVFYKGPKFSRDQPSRWPVYAVWREGEWGPRLKLEWADPRGADIYSNNCGQRVTLPNGDVAMAFTFGAGGRPRAVCGVISEFDGERLRIRSVGPPLEHPHGRGLLEPSVTRHQGRFLLTIRAEDNRGYVSVSEDGLHYQPHQPWQWEDGEPLEMSTTQQHWLTHSQGLFLVYTRRDASNANVTRWRSPLWLAQVNPRTLRLRRETERVVLPLMGDGINDPDRVALMGNFHVTTVSAHESWVTVGEWHPRNLALGGDVLLARIQWGEPNELAG